MYRLSLLLTLAAVLCFTGTTWLLARDVKIDFNDGLVLVGIFFFWQSFQLFDVLRGHVREPRPFGWWLWVDLAMLRSAPYGL